CNRAIAIDPNDVLAFNDRGVAYSSKGEYDRAIEDFDRAMRLDPINTLATNNRRIAYDAKIRVAAAATTKPTTRVVIGALWTQCKGSDSDLRLKSCSQIIQSGEAASVQ